MTDGRPDENSGGRVGAIGGYVGIRLALAGENVTFIARGANLHVTHHGIRLVMSDGTEESLPAPMQPRTCCRGPQDVVILAMKLTGRRGGARCAETVRS